MNGVAPFFSALNQEGHTLGEYVLLIRLNMEAPKDYAEPQCEATEERSVHEINQRIDELSVILQELDGRLSVEDMRRIEAELKCLYREKVARIDEILDATDENCAPEGLVFLMGQ